MRGSIIVEGPRFPAEAMLDRAWFRATYVPAAPYVIGMELSGAEEAELTAKMIHREFEPDVQRRLRLPF